MKVLVVASHSGGHISPAIAFCQGLRDKKSDIEINFISTDGEIEKKLLSNNFGPIFFKRKKISIFSCYRLINLIFEARGIIRKLKPNLIVGFGGYLSIPFIICAHFKKIPNFIHEQNMRMGLANRLLSLFSDSIIFSFPNTQFGDRLKNKALTLGAPLRKNLNRIDKKEAKRYFGLDAERFTILIMGGSQGSHKINTQVAKILNDNDLSDSQVIHITGFFDYRQIEENYKRLKIKNRIFPFFDRMDYAFSACDVAICRAGASTIAEIIAFKVPSVLIPYPYAKYHQLDNARFLVEKNAAVLLEDKFCSDHILKEKIIDFKNNPDKLRRIECALNEINMFDAREKMAELALSLMQ